jgi:hypothetical protein
MQPDSLTGGVAFVLIWSGRWFPSHGLNVVTRFAVAFAGDFAGR